VPERPNPVADARPDPTADQATPATPGVVELGGPARIVVVALVLAGLVFAIPGGISLIFYVPFGTVGALLAIRRPRTSIGWLLVAVAFGFAFVSTPINATADQFRGHTADLITVFHAVMTGAAAGTSFLMLAVLAVVFPSGRLPGGRWGRAVRVGILLGLVGCVLVVVTPETTLSLAGQTASVRVPNPASVLPDLPIWQVITPDTAILPLIALLAVAAVSLAVRFRRSTGVERQQIRWLGAALIQVVVAVVFGLVVSSIVPAAGESGLAWIPAMVSFPGIPLSILVAVLRYRLYEIDTLINRALVYGLVTAVLAGGSAAAIGVTERVFQGVVGPGSDATIVLTTLIVVGAFEPIKKRIQALVDRRFKEVKDPAVVLAAFLAELRGTFSAPDAERTMQRLAEAVAAAYRAPAVEVRLASPGAADQVIGVGSPTGAATMGATADAGVLHATIGVFGGNPSLAVAPLAQILADVLAELHA
jgi:hypothetical protein